MADASNHPNNPETPARAKNKQLEVEHRQTPRRADSTQRRNYQLHLTEFRELVLETMGTTIPMLTLDEFFESSVPEVPRAVLDATWKELKKMKRNGVRVIDPTTDRWSWYEKDPGDMDGNEDDVYQYIEHIWNAVLDAAKKSLPGEERTAGFRCRPTSTASSETQNSNFKTDGDVERLPKDGKPRPAAARLDAFDSVVNLEFKKKVTLEDVNKDPEPLIKFVLAISFASDEEMGYDPTVQRVVMKKEVVYDYQVTGSYGEVFWYRTKKCLCNYQSLRISSRAIRVWEVDVLDSDKEPVYDDKNEPLTAVLKDYWIPLDATQESVTQEKIKKAYQENKPKRSPEINPSDYLMTILHDIIVQVAGRDDTSQLYLRNGIPSDYKDFRLVQTDLPPQRTKSSNMNGTNSKLRNGTGGGHVEGGREARKFDQPRRGRRRVYEPRKHCRLVFKEIGVRLDEIYNQKVLLECLMDATRVLQIFYEAKWVHRDVSVGNLLMCPSSKDKRGFVCKITDLEYARPFRDEKVPGTEHDHKTGTPAYMAVEVQADLYQFGANITDGNSRLDARASHMDDGESSGEGDYTDDEDVPPQRNANLKTTDVFPFFHNYLHDVEALWWIIMWNVFSTVPGDAESFKDMAVEDYEKRNAHAEELFPASVDGNVARLQLMINDSAFTLHRNRLDKGYHGLMDHLGGTRYLLRRRYIDAENPPEKVLDHKAYKGVHKLLRDEFSLAKKYALEEVTYLDNLTDAKRRMMDAGRRKPDPKICGGQPTTGSKRRLQADDPSAPSGNPKKRPKSNLKSKPTLSASDNSTPAAGPGRTRRTTRSRKSSAGSSGPRRRNPARKCNSTKGSQA
ncbi:hypothetical protein V5O48_002433 [Marasmius crinis-equi]|uniref:Fungal-type protein kinase domain-containing protein n=1 Tax=Marasmius crinis-equi TaxID=585013 RepID=A0ABR3FVQ7_9AGAR